MLVANDPSVSPLMPVKIMEHGCLDPYFVVCEDRHSFTAKALDDKPAVLHATSTPKSFSTLT